MLKEKVSILLVDDLSSNLLALESVLSDEDYKLVRAYSGQEALKQVLLYDFAVIVLDVQMPVMDGFETARLLNHIERTKDVPIIFMTASERETRSLLEAYSLGAFDYMIKPFNPDELRNKVGRLSDLYREKMKLKRELDSLKRDYKIEERIRIAGEMAVGIAHELRNPMTAIQGFLQYANQNVGALNEKHIHVMMEEINQANAFISEFIHLSSNKRLEKEEIDVNRIVQEQLPSIREKALEYGVHVRFLPGPSRLIHADRSELKLLLKLLTDNGVESMSSGGTITLATHVQGDETVFVMRDEGAGMAPEVLDKAGVPFFTTKEGRKGLGLAICYSIVERHNGRIEVCSDATGTVFLIFLGQ